MNGYPDWVGKSGSGSVMVEWATVALPKPVWRAASVYGDRGVLGMFPRVG